MMNIHCCDESFVLCVFRYQRKTRGVDLVFRQLKIVLWLMGFMTGLVIVIFVINQTNQVVALATAFSPLLGQVVLYALLAVYFAVILLPILFFLFMSPPLTPPTSQQDPRYPHFLRHLCIRLRRNPLTKKMHVDPADLRSIEAALQVLDQAATTRIKDTAAQVFVATAVSQYGRLDALLVLMAQIRLIWQVSSIYNTRPHWRDVLRLYLNVGATVVVSNELENIDLLESQLEPLLVSFFGSSIAMLANGVGAVVVNSLLQGSANAFLTLRVGVIAKGYLAALQTPNRTDLRRSALAQSATLLGSVLAESLSKVTGAFMRVVKRSTLKAAKTKYQNVARRFKRATVPVSDTGDLVPRGIVDAVQALFKRILRGGSRA